MGAEGAVGGCESEELCGLTCCLKEHCGVTLEEEV